ncbi:hypothetical protein GL213_05235 [Halogeometricum borinquense]|uniref:Uncharacterized protein n=1 Tax=Halogeometricum borinquense TaxID=60847 RepID=A0A6C0UHL2_9EURY|nr:hypothetical protein [Halogeometricum borinquense]QIB75044.1 hypothetical protein G3I44_12595 [Halogeometricum borinquense]QIQ75975.1 hypothetical protein GL213_05235 [Halogeometricum borinquense]
MYDPADANCPKCGSTDTHASATIDLFICATCGFETPHSRLDDDDVEVY